MRKLSDDVYVSDQVELADLAALKEQGIRTLIINRPDNESPNQTNSQALITAAQALGLAAHYIPVATGGDYTRHADAFAAAVEHSQGPVLAFCRSGYRSEKLWRKTQKTSPPRSVFAFIRRALSGSGHKHRDPVA